MSKLSRLNFFGQAQFYFGHAQFYFEQAQFRIEQATAHFQCNLELFRNGIILWGK